MKEVFADTCYWVALLYPGDGLHRQAQEASRDLRYSDIFTSEGVLTEFLATFAESGKYWRQQAIDAVGAILRNPRMRVIPQTHSQFEEGCRFYQARLDKGYSLTDCVSMLLMTEHRINYVLTRDHHFRQEGFNLALV